MIAGVCAGIGEYFDVDPTVIRVFTVFLACLSLGAVIFVYLVLMICVPKSPDYYSKYVDVDPVEASTMNAERSRQNCPVDPRCEKQDQNPPTSSVGTPAGTPADASVGAPVATTAGTSADAEQGTTGTGSIPSEVTSGYAPTSDYAYENGPMSGSVPVASEAPTNPTPGAAYSATYGTAYNTQKKNDSRRHAFPFIVIGVVLIVIGVLNLLNQIFPVIQWWEYWPLLILAIGVYLMVGTKKRHWTVGRFFWGLAIVVFSLVLCACTVGYLGWGVWIAILSYWPLLLIAIGLTFIASPTHIKGFRAAGTAMLVLMMAVGVYGYQVSRERMLQPIMTMGTSSSGSPQASDNNSTASMSDVNHCKKVSLEGYENATLSFSSYGMELGVFSGDDDSVLLASSNAMLEKSALGFTCGNKVANVYVDGHLPVGAVAEAGVERVELSKTAYWKSMTFTPTCSDENINLRGIKASEVKLNPTLSNVSVTLGVPVDTSSSLSVDSTVSGFDLVIPDGVQVAIKTGGDANAVASGSTLVWNDDAQEWRTAGYADASSRGAACWTVVLDGTFTSCRIRQGAS